MFYPIFLEETYATNAREVFRSLQPQFDEMDATMEPLAASYAKDRLSTQALHRFVPPMPYTRLADHIEYIARLVGTEHVGLGSDYDGINCVPAGLETGAELPKLAAELARRGFNAEQLAQMLGRNILRVMNAL